MNFLSFMVFCYFLIITADCRKNYIIHMNSSAMPTPYSSPSFWYLATLQSVCDESLTQISTKKLLYTYSHAIHGFSATLTCYEIDQIKKKPGYLFSMEDSTVKLLTTHSIEFLDLYPNFGAWPASSLGKDVIIGVIDTGVWPESKSYNDDGFDEIPSRWKGECQTGTLFDPSMCNRKLIGARYFNKGFRSRYQEVNISMNSARDTNGHGTHTSSIAAGNFVRGASYFGYGNGTAKGVAPHARLAMYKALWDGDQAETSDFLAAIDQSILDGVDVLSMSITSKIPYWHKDPIAIASFAATEKGIFVSMAGGNYGSPLTVANAMPWVSTIAAGTIDRQFTGMVTFGNGVFVPGTSLYDGKFNSSQIPMVFIGACNNETKAYRAWKKIAVCFSEKVPLDLQVFVIKSSKAAAGVFITKEDWLLDDRTYDFPLVFLNQQDGKILRDYIREEGSQATGRITFRLTHFGTVRAPMVSDFSSRGPFALCSAILKPDLLAPGQQILGSWPSRVLPNGESSKFNLKSGTSMACPHAAGLAAIVKSVHPDWSPAAIRSAMMTTASITDNTFHPIQEIIGPVIKEATPLAMGAGHISPNKAIKPGLIYDMDMRDYVNLLCGLNFTRTQIHMITRSSNYNCSNPTLDVNYPSFIATYQANETYSSTGKQTRVFQRTLTSVEDGMSTYRVTLTGLNGFNVTVEPELLVFTKKNDKKRYTLILEGPALKENVVVHGFLSWVSTKSKNIVVRSPIVAMGHISLSDH